MIAYRGDYLSFKRGRCAHLNYNVEQVGLSSSVSASAEADGNTCEAVASYWYVRSPFAKTIELCL